MPVRREVRPEGRREDMIGTKIERRGRAGRTGRRTHAGGLRPPLQRGSRETGEHRWRRPALRPRREYHLYRRAGSHSCDAMPKKEPEAPAPSRWATRARGDGVRTDPFPSVRQVWSSVAPHVAIGMSRSGDRRPRQRERAAEPRRSATGTAPESLQPLSSAGPDGPAAPVEAVRRHPVRSWAGSGRACGRASRRESAASLRETGACCIPPDRTRRRRTPRSIPSANDADGVGRGRANAA